MHLSIVVPCYNEEKNLPLLIERFAKIVEYADLEVIFVNNGSTDNSASIFETLLPAFSCFRSIHVPINQGYGYGVLAGLRQARGEYIGWTHADLQTDPSDILKAYKLLKTADRPAFIKGNRKNRGLLDTFFTVGMSLFESIYLQAKLYDINAQPTIFPKSFFELWESPPNDFSLDLYSYFMAIKHKLEIVRFPVLFPERIHGQSSWNTSFKAKWKFIKRTIAFSVHLKKAGIR